MAAHRAARVERVIGRRQGPWKTYLDCWAQRGQGAYSHKRWQASRTLERVLAEANGRQSRSGFAATLAGGDVTGQLSAFLVDGVDNGDAAHGRGRRSRKPAGESC